MEKQHIKLSESDQIFMTDLLLKETLKVQKYKCTTALQLLSSGKTLIETMNIL